MKESWAGAQIDFSNFIHNYHKTSSLIYDYSGIENYFGRYLMTDLDIGTTLNFVTANFVDGAGHWVQQEKPNDVSKLLLKFLKIL